MVDSILVHVITLWFSNQKHRTFHLVNRLHFPLLSGTSSFVLHTGGIVLFAPDSVPDPYVFGHSGSASGSVSHNFTRTDPVPDLDPSLFS
jgi:hypothetical protein